MKFTKAIAPFRACLTAYKPANSELRAPCWQIANQQVTLSIY